MSDTYSKLEVVVTDRSIQIWRNHRHCMTLGVDNISENLIVANKRPNTVVDQVPIDVNKLDVDITVQERSQLMGVVKHKTTAASTRSIKVTRPSSSSTSQSAERVVTSIRDLILFDIIDSLARTKDQSKKDIAAETMRIAAKYKEGKFVVAGIRANLTRGAYGNPVTMIANRRRELTRQAREATAVA